MLNAAYNMALCARGLGRGDYHHAGFGKTAGGSGKEPGLWVCSGKQPEGLCEALRDLVVAKPSGLSIAVLPAGAAVRQATAGADNNAI